MADTDYNEWILLDTDLETRLAILPVISSHLYLEFCEPGSGEVRIPLDSRAAGLVTPGMFCECYYRGQSRGGFFVDNIKEVEADAGEGGGRVMSLSGRGALALLNDAIVWDDGSGATTRTWNASTKAQILIDMIDEAKARGALANLTVGFDGAKDSDAVAWDDSEEYKLNVGMSLLDLLREFVKTGIEFEISLSGGSFVLNAYKNGIGTDKSDTVYLRIGSNCVEVSDDQSGDDIVNAMRVKFKDGYITVSDNTSISNYRRRESLLNIEQAQSGNTASTYASAILDNRKSPRRSISVRVHDGVPPHLFLDYVIGDTVTIDTMGNEASYRILGIQADFNSDGYGNVVLELNNILYENQLKIENELNWILNQWNSARDANQIEAVLWSQVGTLSGVSGDFVWDMLISGGYLYVAWLQSISNETCNVGRFHLTNRTWEIVGSGNYPQLVTALGEVNGTIYAAGLNSDRTEEHVWKLNGSTWTSIGEITNGGGEYVLVGNGSNLYIAGQDKMSVDSAYMDKGVGVWNGASWSAVGGAASGKYYYGMTIWNGDLYVGGNGGLEVYLGGGSWSSVGNLPTGASNIIFDIAGTSDYLYIALSNKLYRWDGVSANAALVATCSTNYPGSIVYSLKTNLSDVYIGGKFTGFSGVSLQLNSIAKYSGGQFYGFEGGVGADGVGEVYAVEVSGDDLFVGGNFVGANGRYDGSNYVDYIQAQSLAARISGFENVIDFATRNNTFDLAGAIHNAPASALTDNDEFGFWEDVTQAIRKITWANIKSTLKTYLDTLYVALTGNQSIDGVKTFTSFPVTPSSAPTTDYQVANKKYVDDNAGGATTDLTNHINDTTDAHDASAISVADSGGYFAGSDVEAVLQEVGTEIHGGWIPTPETWTRTGNHTFTVSGDLTTKYRKGTFIRYRDGGSDEYGVVGSSSHSSGTTTVTLITNTDYAMAAATITDKYISYIGNPQGLPDAFNFALSASSGITLGNASVEAVFKTVSNRIWVGGRIVFGNSTSVSGDTVFNLPIAGIVPPARALQNIGFTTLRDASPATTYNGSAMLGSSSTVIVRVFNSGGTYVSLAALSSTVPFTWTTDDSILFNFSYLF